MKNSRQLDAGTATVGAAASQTQNDVTQWSVAGILKTALLYGTVGAVFGIMLIKAEVISWYRIQEMFRFQSFHMYGVIGSAIATGAISLLLIRAFRLRSLSGDRITLAPKRFHMGYIYGGVTFGLGWALVGACPGPIFAHIGAGTFSFGIVLLSALAGTWVYSYLRPRLPH